MRLWRRNIPMEVGDVSQSGQPSATTPPHPLPHLVLFTAFLVPDYRHIRIGFMISLSYHSEPKWDPKKIHAPESRPITRK